MGGSSRPPFELTDSEETDSFFADSLEKWREKMGITQFILAGHSFGGYVSGVYASFYPQHIKKLLLLSPIGVR